MLGVLVVVEGDILFYLYIKCGGYIFLQWVEMIDVVIMQLGKWFILYFDFVYIESSDIVIDLMYGNKVIVLFIDQDGLWEGCLCEQLVMDKWKIVVQKLKELKEEYSLW